MKHFIKSSLAGIAAGIVTFHVSITVLALTNAIAMPRGFPVLVWEAFVVLGTGATLVGFLIHFLAIRALAADTPPAFLAHAATLLAAMAMSGLLVYGGRTLAAWLAGALLASLVHRRLRPAASRTPPPLNDAV